MLAISGCSEVRCHKVVLKVSHETTIQNPRPDLDIDEQSGKKKLWIRTEEGTVTKSLRNSFSHVSSSPQSCY